MGFTQKKTARTSVWQSFIQQSVLLIEAAPSLFPEYQSAYAVHALAHW